MLRIILLSTLVSITLTTSCLSEPFQSTGTIAAYFSPRGGATEALVSSNNNVHLVMKPIYANNTSSYSDTISTTAGQFPTQIASAGSSTIDWTGIWIDTGILFGSQLATCGLLYTMPESVTHWSDEQKRRVYEHYSENFVRPEWDNDVFYLNYVLHPYWGGAYYIRGRERGLDQLSSFIYSALMSAMFEFGTECFFERPSLQDLIVTPTAGALLGGFVFEPWRNYIKNKPELYWYDHASLIFTDPLGLLSLSVEKMFGIKSSIVVDYSPQLKHATGAAVTSKSDYIGATWKFQWN